MGRKNKYESHVKPYLSQIAEWYETMTEEQIAVKLGVSVASFENYKSIYPELKDCLTNAKRAFCVELKDALKKKAIGFHAEETKTSIRQEGSKEIKVIEKTKKYYPPDTGAIHLLLKNLDPEWRNDDKETMDMKKAKLELERLKAEAENW